MARPFMTSGPHAVQLLVAITATLLVAPTLSAADLTWVGGNNNNAWDVGVGATLNWADLLGPTWFTDGDFVTFDDTGSNSPPVNVVGTVAPGSVTFANSTGHDYTLTGQTIAVAGDMNLNGSGNVTVSNAALSVTGLLGINSGVLILNPAAGSDFTLAGNLSGAGTLRKEGVGTAILGGDNSAFAGPIVIAAGTLKANGNTGLGAGGTEATGVTVLDGATLDVLPTNGASTEVVTMSGTGVDGKGALVATAGTDAISRVNQVILTGDTRIAAIALNGKASNLVVGGEAGAFQGNGHNLHVFVDTASQVDLQNVGETDIHNVVISGDKRPLYLAGDSTLGPDSGTVTLANARLGFYGPTSTEAPPSTITFTKPIVVDPVGGCIEVYPGSKAIDSPITMDGNFETTTYCIANNSTATITLNGKLTGPGGLAVHLYASTTTSRLGMVALTANDNDYTGPTTIGGGGGFKNVVAARDRVSLSIGNGGTTGSLGPGDVTVTAPGRLRFNRVDTFTFPNNISGTGHVNLDAAGAVVTLTGNNTYSGTTTISAGTLKFASHTGGGKYTVGSGATLDLTNMTAAPLSVTDLVVNDNAAFHFRLLDPNSTTDDEIVLTGALDLSAVTAITIQVTSLGDPILPDGNYLLASTSGTLTPPAVTPTLTFIGNNPPARVSLTVMPEANAVYLSIGDVTLPPKAADIEPTGGDGDVDMADLNAILACALGPELLVDLTCATSDLDRDGDVDQSDFGIWQACFSGSGVQASVPDCTAVTIP